MTFSTNRLKLLNVHKYFKPFLEHHLSSMNNFVKKAIPKIVQSHFPICAEHNGDSIRIELFEVIVGTPVENTADGGELTARTWL